MGQIELRKHQPGGFINGIVGAMPIAQPGLLEATGDIAYELLDVLFHLIIHDLSVIITQSI